MTDTNTISLPSFRTKDMSDKFYFVGRLKEQVLETKDFTRDNGESFTVVSLRVVHERLDADTITPRYSFYRVPSTNVGPRSPLGQYLTGMETAGTPISFGKQTGFDEANEALEEQVGNIYVLCQTAISQGRDKGREPDRFCLPIARVGYGQDWDADEAKRIISEARGVSAEAVVAKAAAVPQAATLSETSQIGGFVTPAQMTAAPITDWQSQLSVIANGKTPAEATKEATAWFNQNRQAIPNGGSLLAVVASGKIWDQLQTEGYVTIGDTISATAAAA